VSIFDQMSLPEAYERFLVEPLFRPFAEQLLNRLHPTSSDSLLDVACGSGIVGRVARQTLGPHARIVGVDASPGMLAVARQVEPTIEWREGNAMALPVGTDERFSCVTCHQGLQFFPDKLAAVREMHRVLSSQGRAGVATWLSVTDMPFAEALHLVAERLLGPTADTRHSLGDGNVLAQLLTDAGFRDAHVETVRGVVSGIDGPTYARLNTMAIVGMSPHAKTLPEAERAALTDQVVTDSLAIIRNFTREGVFEFEVAANMATARV
jgi:ubiquinone/menaquinone biosynthesis C-methylase UbiE